MKIRTWVKVFISICLLLLTACGNDSGANADDKEDTAKQEEQSDTQGQEDAKDVAVSDYLDDEATVFEETDHEKVVIKDAKYSDDRYFGYAQNGILLTSGNSMVDFFDYKNGQMYEKMEDAMGPTNSRGFYVDLLLTDDFYYAIEPDNDMNYHMYEIDLATGKEKKLMDIGEDYNDFRFNKKDGILYVENPGTLIAIDTKKEETLWEVDTDTDLFADELYLTDQTIVLFSEDGVAVYSQKDGEKQYEADGNFVEAAVDGNDLYVLEMTLDSTDDNDWHVLKFNEEQPNGENMMTTPEINLSNQSEEADIHVDDEMMYVTVQYGMFAFDMQDGSEKWATAIDGTFEEPPSDGPVYEMETAYANGKVYIRTMMSEAGEKTQTRMTILDGSSGEVAEHIALEDAHSLGPEFDGEQIVVASIPDEDDPIVYMFD